MEVIKEALLYKKLKEEKRVQCITCERECIIPFGKTGFCKTRKNEDGKLFTFI